MNEVVSADDGRKYKTQVARPGARPGDPSEANGDPKRDARAAKDAQKMCKRVPRGPREGNGRPKRDTRAAKDAQEGLKTDQASQERPTGAQKGTLERPRTPKRGSKGTQVVPKGAPWCTRGFIYGKMCFEVGTQIVFLGMEAT